MRNLSANLTTLKVLVLAAGLFLAILPPTASSANDTLTEEQASVWIEDLDFLGENLPKLHYDAFNSISEAEFNANVELLRGQIPTLSENEVVIEISKLVSLVKDSHTAIDSYHHATHYFPLQVGYFIGEGPRVIAVQSTFSEVLQAELTKINGIPLSEIENLLDQTFYTDNTMGAINKYPQMLVFANVLRGLNITDGSNQAVWSFSKAGQEFDLTIPAVLFGDDIDWVTVFTEDSPTPMYRQQVGNPYYYIWNPELKILYFQYNSCVERDDLSFEDFTYMLMDAVQEYPFERFIIDLRHNTGGNSAILDPLISLLADNEKVNQEGVLFVITGRSTYSSAVLNSISIKQQTKALFVGEPTGGRPNTYGELMHFTLPNSQLRINYSTKYFSWSKDDTDAIYPDIEVYVSLEEFVNGHDPALAAILAY